MLKKGDDCDIPVAPQIDILKLPHLKVLILQNWVCFRDYTLDVLVQNLDLQNYT